jgi:hypothetical protein
MQEPTRMQTTLMEDFQAQALQDKVTPIFKRKLCESSTEDSLIEFEQLLANKPVGYWLIRESRKEGMLSITFKEAKDTLPYTKISHTRFLFTNRKWHEVNDESRVRTFLDDKTLFEPATHELNKKKIALLIRTIKRNYSLKYENILLPVEKHASLEPSYFYIAPYVLSSEQDSEEQKIDNNPCDALDNLMKIIIKVRDRVCGIQQTAKDTTWNHIDLLYLSSIELPAKKELFDKLANKKFFAIEGIAKEYKDIFEKWIKINKLDEGLICPVSGSLFIEPYYVRESKQVYDGDTNGASIPIRGYRKKLEQCLLEFYELIEVYQERLAIPSEIFFKKAPKSLLLFEAVSQEGFNEFENNPLIDQGHLERSEISPESDAVLESGDPSRRLG